jgi:hypothetical protein
LDYESNVADNAIFGKSNASATVTPIFTLAFCPREEVSGGIGDRGLGTSVGRLVGDAVIYGLQWAASSFVERQRPHPPVISILPLLSGEKALSNVLWFISGSWARSASRLNRIVA